MAYLKSLQTSESSQFSSNKIDSEQNGVQLYLVEFLFLFLFFGGSLCLVGSHVI